MIWVDVDDATALRILLVDNRSSDVATYEDAQLAELLQALLTDTGTLDGTGWDEVALRSLLNGLGSDASDQGGALGDVEYQVVVSCADEHHQAQLCEELEQRGLKCRLLTL